MSLIEEISQAILKEKGFHFRGIALGDSLDKVEALEGVDYEEVTGSLPHYEYYEEVGEAEEIQGYYKYEAATKKVVEIQLFFYFYPKIYWEGKQEQDFWNLVQQGQLESLSPIFEEVKDKVVQELTHQLGPPKTSTQDTVFSPTPPSFEKWVWQSPQENLVVTSYVDDKTTSSIRQVLRLALSSSYF